MPHYHGNIFWSDRESCWIADVPDLKHCTAPGTTVADAAREIEIALSLWLEPAVENGDGVPLPHYRPEPIHQAA